MITNPGFSQSEELRMKPPMYDELTLSSKSVSLVLLPSTRIWGRDVEIGVG